MFNSYLRHHRDTPSFMKISHPSDTPSAPGAPAPASFGVAYRHARISGSCWSPWSCSKTWRRSDLSIYLYIYISVNVYTCIRLYFLYISLSLTMVIDLISIYSISFHIFPYQPKLQVLWLRPRHVRRVPGPAVEGLSFSFSFSFSVSCGTGGGTCLFTSPNYWTHHPQQIPWFCSQVMFEIRKQYGYSWKFEIAGLIWWKGPWCLQI